jgi:hypothetical protein
MRLIIRHAIAILLVLFVCRVAVQAHAKESHVNLPKAILLSRLAASSPIPSRDFDQRPILKAIVNESERFIDRQKGRANR